MGASTIRTRAGKAARCGRPPARACFHLEGGKENRPKAIKLQLRPDPLAR